MRATSGDRQLEAHCNGIAAAILMPRSAVLARSEVATRAQNRGAWDYASLRAAASPFGVSTEAFLLRLVTLGQVDRNVYQARRDEFRAYDEAAVSGQPGGGNWYRNTARDRGKGYVRRVADAHRRRVIDSYTAASFLDVEVDQIAALAAAAALRVPA